MSAPRKPQVTSRLELQLAFPFEAPETADKPGMVWFAALVWAGCFYRQVWDRTYSQVTSLSFWWVFFWGGGLETADSLSLDGHSGFRLSLWFGLDGCYRQSHIWVWG